MLRNMVAPAHNHPVADGFNALRQSVPALGGFLAGADLIVVEGVFFANRHGRQVRHAHVGARQNALFPALGMDGSQGCGGRQEHRRQHQADDTKQEQSQLQAALRGVTEGGVAMGDEWTDAHHLGLQVMKEQQVLGDAVRGLPGGANHKAAAHLVADVFQIPQAPHPVVEGQVFGVQAGVMRRVRRFMAQKVPVCPCRLPALIDLPGVLAHGERDGAFRVLRFDGAHQLLNAIRRIPGVFSPLKDEGAVAQRPALPAAVEDFFFGQAVALGIRVATADAAVKAVILAVIGKFDEPADVDILAVMAMTDLPRPGEELLCQFRRAPIDEGNKFLVAENALPLQLVDQRPHDVLTLA